jgi:hypothetical protein
MSVIIDNHLWTDDRARYFNWLITRMGECSYIKQKGYQEWFRETFAAHIRRGGTVLDLPAHDFTLCLRYLEMALGISVKTGQALEALLSGVSDDD